MEKISVLLIFNEVNAYYIIIKYIFNFVGVDICTIIL